MSTEYLAGLFDGEGWVSILTRRRPNLSLGVVVGVKMTHYEAVAAFHQRFGGSLTKTVPSNPAHSPTWTWRVCSKDAATALRAMLPYLLVKKPQARVGLSVAKHLNEHATPGRKTAPEVLALREKLLTEFLSLPKRGNT